MGYVASTSLCQFTVDVIVSLHLCIIDDHT